MEGAFNRHYDPTIVQCEDCDWIGQVKDCIHGYTGILFREANPCDYCPKCHSEHLIPLGRELVPV